MISTFKRPKQDKASSQFITLHSGDLMPKVGLGTWKIPKDTAADNIVTAIRLGYRHLDCACDYGNEKEVGEGIRRAISEGIIADRSELFVTSKLWNTYHAKEHVPLALQRSLEDLGLDYVDLYLIHFPISLKFVPFETRYPPEWTHDPSADLPCMEYTKVSLQETWFAMESVLSQGKCRNIGVCNLTTSGLRDVLSYATVKPAVLQIERHLHLQQPRLTRFCASEGVAVVGFSPLGSGSYLELGMASSSDSPLTEPEVVAIAHAHGKSPAQVLLKWGLQQTSAAAAAAAATEEQGDRFVVIPKSTDPKRLAQNLDLFSFELSDEEVASLAGLDKNKRFNDPGAFTQSMNSFCPIFD
mmetsp:Transcript_5523/g.10372  ORF Transcript_5523/g.10372 Transcript_5523/m.10372 type:complete len:356 (-) Transcript_5523:312-1379(-)